MDTPTEYFWLSRRGWIVSIALIFAVTCLPGIVVPHVSTDVGSADESPRTRAVQAAQREVESGEAASSSIEATPREPVARPDVVAVSLRSER